jgi:DNA-binding MarR family transcriptional regulator
MSRQKSRKALIEALIQSGREMSRVSLLFRHSVAEAMGLHVTDAECIDYLLEAGYATAGQLATMTGLTTGSVTTMIDRLEKAGFVRREADAKDRRKVIVKPIMEKITQFFPFYDTLVKEANLLFSQYTDEELALLTEHNNKLMNIYEQQITKIREKKSSSHN